jgi:hypothetical protein
VLARVLLEPRVASRVEAVVVEFGNARYQALVDAYVAGETPSLPPVWRDTVGGILSRVFESPVYRAFFDVARRAVAAGARFRVVLGDPPSREHGRDAFFADAVEEHIGSEASVLALAGTGRLARVSDVDGGNVVQRLEARGLECRVVLPHYVFRDIAERRADDLVELERRLAGWSVPSLVPIAGSGLEDVDATLLLDDRALRLNPDGTRIEVAVAFRDARGHRVLSPTLRDAGDAYLYLGRVESLTLASPAP